MPVDQSYRQRRDGARAPDGRELHLVSEFDELRCRYLRLGLWVSVGVNVLGLLDWHAPVIVECLRVAVALFCLACLGVVRAQNALAMGRIVTAVMGVGIVTIAMVRMPEGWPVNLNLLLLLAVFGTLVGGTRVSTAVSLVAIGSVSIAYALQCVAAPAYLHVQLTNWILALVLLQLFMNRLANLLAQGATELMGSAEAMVSAERAANEVAQLLSSRVARAVDDLARKLEQSPTEAGTEVDRLQKVLVSSRRSIPPEPKLPEATLAQKMEALRLQTMDWTLGIALCFLSLTLLRNAIAQPPINLHVGVAGLVIVGMGWVLRLAWPQQRARINEVMLPSVVILCIRTLWDWFARAPISPPIFPALILVSLLAAVTVGPWLAFVSVAGWSITSLLALHVHPGIAWTAPVNLFATCAVLAWFLRQWPRDIWQAIRAREQTAASKVRERRRLVATLFHDLSNPLLVITVGFDQLAHGEEITVGWDNIRAMVARMQATLAAVLGGRIVLESLSAGQLCDDLQALFAERLARKGIAFTVTGSRTASLQCDVALLRDSVLANLFSNALKFSPEGGSIHLSIVEAGDSVAIVLADEGGGLPEDVRNAFDSGVRAPSHAGTAGEAGSGYGLMLARDYLQEMGGSLELQPRGGGGLLARIVLPRAE